jgi:hypothetical protein
MKKIFTWRSYLIFYLFIILLSNIIILNFPLTNVFGYEFSIFNSLLLVLFVGIYTVYFFRIYFNKLKIDFIGELFKSIILFLLIPFSVSIINSFFTGFCSFTDGLLFYIVITIPSVFIGIALGLYVVQYSFRIQIILLIFLYLGILGIMALEIYFNPQVYLFNPIIGFFPGTVYDESITISSKLITYRFFNLVFFIFIIIASLRIKRQRKKNSLAILNISILVISISFYFLSPRLGYSTTFNSLSGELSKTIVSDHFIIHCDKRIDNADVKMLALNHEYYYQELKKFFDCDLTEKINSFIFFDDDQKKELFGSQNADVAKPWLMQVYISYGNWEQTLKHELAHCFSASFGSGMLKLAAGLNPLLIEGIAEAADRFFDENSLHYMASLAYNNGYKVDLEYLLTKFGFFNQSSSISYIYSGSFILYLIGQYGIDNFKKYYVTGEFQTSYGIELKNVLMDYYRFIADKNVNSQDEANFYFGRKSLFQKVCPRSISKELSKGWEHFKNLNISVAERYFKSVLRKVENYSAITGLAQTYDKQDRLGKAVELLKSNISNFISTSYYYNLELVLADMMVRNDELSDAEKLYDSLTIQNPNRLLLYLSYTRKELLRSGAIKQYLEGSNYDKMYLLRKINDKSYNYWTIPVIINLSNRLDEDYDLFLKELNNNFIVNDYSSSYAAYALSEFMLLKFDFANARKMAALSLRYNASENFKLLLNAQYDKTQWFLQNGNDILKNLQIINY